MTQPQKQDPSQTKTPYQLEHAVSEIAERLKQLREPKPVTPKMK